MQSRHGATHVFWLTGAVAAHFGACITTGSRIWAPRIFAPTADPVVLVAAVSETLVRRRTAHLVLAAAAAFPRHVLAPSLFWAATCAVHLSLRADRGVCAAFGGILQVPRVAARCAIVLLANGVMVYVVR